MRALDPRINSPRRHHRAGAQRRDPVIPIWLAVMCLPKRDGRDKCHDRAGLRPGPVARPWRLLL